LSSQRNTCRRLRDTRREPRRLCADALHAFLDRRASGALDSVAEHRALAELYAEIASWFASQADRYPVIDHADRLFVETTLRDSILLPDYALRLVHFMREPGNRDVAIDLRGLLGRHHTQARQVIRALLAGEPWDAEPFDDASGGGYRLHVVGDYRRQMGREFASITVGHFASTVRWC
jgi:hypothetical protein